MSDLLAALAAEDAKYQAVEATDGFELHPVFKGIATVESARLETKNDGTIQLFVKLKTEKGSLAIWQGLTNFKSESQVGYAKKTLLHLGHTGSFAELAQDGGTGHLIGRMVEVQVKHETYEGTTRERVYTNRAVEGGGAAIGDSAANDFAAQFNAVPLPTEATAPSASDMDAAAGVATSMEGIH